MAQTDQIEEPSSVRMATTKIEIIKEGAKEDDMQASSNRCRRETPLAVKTFRRDAFDRNLHPKNMYMMLEVHTEIKRQKTSLRE